MANITLKGNPCKTVGTLPSVGSGAPNSRLVKNDLTRVSLSDFPGKKIVNIFPSIDTPVCATSVRKFNEKAGAMKGVTVLNVSADLPFAQKRWCGAEGLENVHTLSTFDGTFPNDWGVRITDGPLAGVCSRAVVVLDEKNKVLYSEQVPEITQEPNYDKALNALQVKA